MNRQVRSVDSLEVAVTPMTRAAAHQSRGASKDLRRRGRRRVVFRIRLEQGKWPTSRKELLILRRQGHYLMTQMTKLRREDNKLQIK